MIAKVATMDVGIARPGMMVARRLRRKTKMITTTRPAARISVSSASWIERLHEDGLVEGGGEVHARRERGLDPRQLRVDRLGHRDDVRLGLPDDADGDGGCPLESQGAALVLGGQLDPAEILQLDEDAALAADHQVAELLRRLQLAEGAHRELAPLGLDAPGGDLDVAAPDGRLHVLDRESPRRQLRGARATPASRTGARRRSAPAPRRAASGAGSSPAGRRCRRAGAGRSSRPRARASRRAARPRPAWRQPALPRPPAAARGSGPPCPGCPGRRPRRRDRG